MVCSPIGPDFNGQEGIPARRLLFSSISAILNVILEFQKKFPTNSMMKKLLKALPWRDCTRKLPRSNEISSVDEKLDWSHMGKCWRARGSSDNDNYKLTSKFGMIWTVRQIVVS